MPGARRSDADGVARGRELVARRARGVRLDLLAEAAYMLARDDEYLGVLERAQAAHLAAGEGPPIVLLHGPGGSAEHWLRVLPDLARTHRVVARPPRSRPLGRGGEDLDADRMLACSVSSSSAPARRRPRWSATRSAARSRRAPPPRAHRRYRNVRRPLGTAVPA
jgi:hypothetical protein